MIEFKMPSLGADMEDGTLVEWRVKPGDKVDHGDIIADVDTQKGLIEVEVFDEGIIEKLLIAENEKVPVGTTMALIRPVIKKVDGSEVKEMTAPHKKVTPVTETKRVRISPLARKIATVNNIDFTSIHGSGSHGEIVKEDVEKYISEEQKEQERKEPAERIEGKSLTSNAIRNAIATATSLSNKEIPHYYLEIDVDMSSALKWLKNTNKQKPVKERILPVALFIYAVGIALKKVPQLNAVWDSKLILKEETNIALAVSLKDGGVVLPTIHNADEKSTDQIMKNLNEIIPRAKQQKLRSSDLAGSTISITSIGEHGAGTVAGLIFPPHVAIVGFGAIREIPWAERGMLDVRPIVTITLAADHRATDGYTGNKFLIELKRVLKELS